MAYTPEVYILGNAHIFMTALEGLQAIFDPTAGVTAWAGGNGPFPVGVLIKIALIVGLLFQAGRMMHTQQAEIRHVVVALLMYIALFVPSTSIILYNVYNGDTYKVDHVPIGIAYAGGFVSTMSYDLMNTFSQVDNFYTGAGNPLSLSQSGFVGPLKNLLGIQRFPTVMKDANPNLWYTMVSFAQHCNAGYKGFSVQNDVDNTESTDSVYKLMTTSGAYNADSNTYIFNSTYPWNGSGTGGEVVSCSIAATYLSASLQNYFGNVTTGSPSNQAGDIFSSNNDFNAALAKVENDHNYNYSSGGDISSTVESNIGNLFPACTGGGNGSQMTCTAADVGLEFMENTLEACAAKMGVYGATTSKAETDMVIGALPAFCTTMSGALAHQETTFAGMASSFLAFVGPMMTVLQFLFFALAPIVAVLFAFMGPSGPSYIAKYLMFGAWTQSFLPVAAIINNLAQYDAVNQMQHMLQSLMPSAGSTTEPFNLAQFDSISTVFSYASRNLATADMLLAFTPLLTAFVFTGSYFALTQLGNMIVNKEGLNKSQDVATPNMGATTFNSPTVGNAMISSGSGTIGVTNAAVATAPQLSASSTMTAGSQAALSAANSSAVSAGASIANIGSSAASVHNSLANSNSELASNVATLTQTQSYEKKLETALQSAFKNGTDVASGYSKLGTTGAGISFLGFKLGEERQTKWGEQHKAEIAHAESLLSGEGQKIATASAYVQSHSNSSLLQNVHGQDLVTALNNTKSETESAVKNYTEAASLQKSALAAEQFTAGSPLQAQSTYQKMLSTYGDKGTATRIGQIGSYLRTHDAAAYQMAVRQMGANTSTQADKLGIAFHAIANMAATNPLAGAEAAQYLFDRAGYETDAGQDAAPTIRAAQSSVGAAAATAGQVSKQTGPAPTGKMSDATKSRGLTGQQARQTAEAAQTQVPFSMTSEEPQATANDRAAAQSPVGKEARESLDNAATTLAPGKPKPGQTPVKHALAAARASIAHSDDHGKPTVAPVVPPSSSLQGSSAYWAMNHPGWVMAGAGFFSAGEGIGQILLDRWAISRGFDSMGKMLRGVKSRDPNINPDAADGDGGGSSGSAAGDSAASDSSAAESGASDVFTAGKQGAFNFPEPGEQISLDLPGGGTPLADNLSGIETSSLPEVLGGSEAGASSLEFLSALGPIGVGVGAMGYSGGIGVSRPYRFSYGQNGISVTPNRK